jgi:REP element-mobilizing transposase RayT
VPQVRGRNLGLGVAMPTGLKRYYGKGDLHFVTFSCYRRLPLLKTARARNVFVSELGRVRYAMGFRLIGYVVMPEHAHLLISEPREGTPLDGAAQIETRRGTEVAQTQARRRGAVALAVCAIA